MTYNVSTSLWRPYVRTAVAEIEKKFPTTGVGTYPGHDPNQDRAADFMIPAYKTAAGIALGDKVAAYAWANRARLGIWYVIWRGRIISQTRPEAGWIRYFDADSPNDSRSHKNHVHISWYASAPAGWKPAITWDGKSFPGTSAFTIGARGDYITKLGERLEAHGWTGYADGPGPEFTEADRKAVAWFQAKQGWTGADADGYPGAQTWALLMAAPATPKPAPKPATPDTVTPPKEQPVAKFEKVIELDAPGAGNWQGAVQNVVTGEWFLGHSRSRADSDIEDVVLYRFDKSGKYQDKMTLENCTHIYGFGVSDTNVIWLTWNDDTKDVVTLQYEAGKTVTKSAATPMHVFSDGWVDVSFSPSRDWVAHRQRNYPAKGQETYRRYRKQNLLDNVDKQSGVDVVIKTSSDRQVQGFSLVNQYLYVLIGLAPKSPFRIEKWDFATGKKVGELPLDARLGLKDGEDDKVEPEGMDGRTFGMKVGTDDNRRLIVYKLTDF